METVVMLSWEYPPDVVGGLSRHVHALSKALTVGGHQVHVLTRAAPGLPSEETVDGVHILRAAPYFQDPHDFRLWVCHLNFAWVEMGTRLLQTVEGPVVLHAHDWLVAYAARALKHLFRLPLVATIHATEHGRHQGIHDAAQQYINDVEWWLTYEAWRVVVCSQSMRREVQSLFRLSGDKVRVIPNGIDIPAAPDTDGAVPRLRYARPDEALIFHVGRLVPEKGAAVLLQAMPLLLRRRAARLVIAGVGPAEADLRRLASRLRIVNHVCFTGWADDATVHALYRHADAAVVPSTYEPFGIVALEAMAAGTPLVVSDVGGLGEIIRHDENGLKAMPGDPVSLAHALSRFLSDPPLASRLAASARREVSRDYRWVSIAQATAELYTAVRLDRQANGLTPAVTAWPPPVSGALPGRYSIP